MSEGLTASQQHAIKLTIGSLLNAEDNSIFQIDRWRKHFREKSKEYLSTERVKPFNPFEPENPNWPVRDALCHRVAGALALRGALAIIEDVLRMEDEKLRLQAVIAQRDRSGLHVGAEHAHLQEVHSCLARQRLSRRDVWRRGLVTAATSAWKELFGSTPVRSKLDSDGVSLADGADSPWSFDRFLIEVWAEARRYDKTIQRLSFSGIEAISPEK